MFRLKYIPLLLVLLGSLSMQATHNRAGEITYVRIAPFTTVVAGITLPVFTYSITMTKYTDDGQQIADRCQDTIYFGDGQFALVKRQNGGPTGPNCDCNNLQNTGAKCGEIILVDGNYVVKKNIYSTIHTYGAAGTYLIRNYDPNRNMGVHNIPNSAQQPFYVEALLIIENFTGANSSPLFSFPPIDKACLNTCFEHNPGAFDPDGDSLSYEITTSRGVQGATVPGYFYPETGGGSYGIDPVKGLLKWCTPQFVDEYNIAFIVKEWRKGTDGKAKLIGYVLRDMQVIVNKCTLNLPPAISEMEVICIEAGKLLDRNLTVTDPNDKDSVRISGGGGAFSVPVQKATLTPTLGGNRYVTNLRWQTSCEHIQNQPYYSTIKCTDKGGGNLQENKLVTFQTYEIRVVPPSIKGLTATPAGSAINLTWTPSSCNPTANPLVNYLVYRKDGCTSFSADPCSLGIDATTGYSLIARLSPTVAAYFDNNSNNGLIIGQNYSYLVVALYEDGLQSYAGTPLCTELKRDIPVIVNVDVLSTAPSGSVFIRWIPPRTGKDFLDKTVYKGPYKIELYSRSSTQQTFSMIFNTQADSLADLVYTYTHTGIPTDTVAHEYYLDFYSGTTKLGSAARANSIFLKADPADRRINLSWKGATPWTNYLYTISRRDPGAATFSVIGTSSTTTYADKQNVENGKNYCYFVTTEGQYADNTIIRPLVNRSQVACQTAVDKTPPITPTVDLSADCPDGRLEVSWTDVGKVSDDVSFYTLLYKPSIDAEYSELGRTNAGETLKYVNDQANSFAGCYAVSATDINGNTSAVSEEFCVDICPEFDLPNVFSPNNDGINDFFQAVRVRQVKQIELNVVDRWGNHVYHTTDPNFKWNGVNRITGKALSEGTFFFVCDVFEPRLKGTVIRTIKGSVQLVR